MVVDRYSVDGQLFFVADQLVEMDDHIANLVPTWGGPGAPTSSPLPGPSTFPTPPTTVTVTDTKAPVTVDECFTNDIDRRPRHDQR